jgi:hypothetical protein
MHTATNYYLFSLAVSDLLFLMMGKLTKLERLKYDRFVGKPGKLMERCLRDVDIVYKRS